VVADYKQTFFSASFFDFSPGNTGAHASKWLALYWGLTLFLTAIVFVARALLFRNRSQLKRESIDKLLAETSNFVDADEDESEEIDEKRSVGNEEAAIP